MAARYGGRHQAERARWEPIVNAGQGYCTEPACVRPYGPRTGRWIPPGSEWDLAHNHRTGGWRGPAHAKCNRREGGIRGNRSPSRKARRRAAQFATSRRW